MPVRLSACVQGRYKGQTQEKSQDRAEDNEVNELFPQRGARAVLPNRATQPKSVKVS